MGSNQTKPKLRFGGKRALHKGESKSLQLRCCCCDKRYSCLPALARHIMLLLLLPAWHAHRNRQQAVMGVQ
jgi:hypothetical protein